MGKPSSSNVLLSYHEYIVIEKATWRTETSKYPEEKKEKSIPLVVASERGKAQTSLTGVVGLLYESKKLIA